VAAEVTVMGTVVDAVIVPVEASVAMTVAV